MIAVDTSAIMAVMLGEKTATDIVERLANNDLCMSAGTLSELLIVAMSRGMDGDTEELLHDLGVEIVAVDAIAAKQVKETYVQYGKGRHPAGLNFGDCFAYVLAKSRNVPLLFVGDDFAKTDVQTP